MSSPSAPAAAEFDAGDIDFLVDRALERHLTDRGMFGSPATCLAFLDRVAAAGVDEVACLIDFGVAPDTTRRALDALATVRDRVAS